MLDSFERLSQIIRRRISIILAVCVCGVVAAPFLLNSFHPPYSATARMLVVNEGPKSVSKETLSAGVDVPSIAESSTVLERVKSKLKLDQDLDVLRKAVKVKNSGRSSITEVNYRDPNAERAVTIANTVADETAGYYHEISTSRYDDVVHQLEQSIVDVKSRLDSLSARVQVASANNPFATSDTASTDLTTQYAALRAARDQAYADLLADRAAQEALAAQGPKIAGIVKRETLTSDPQYTKIEAQLSEDEATLAAQSATYTSAYPAVAALREKVALERAQLEAAAASALRSHTGSSQTFASNVLEERKAAGKTAGDEARVRAFDAEIAQAEGYIRGTFGPGATGAVLRAERDAARVEYVSLTQRLSAAKGDATEAASLGTLVVVDRAIAEDTLLVRLAPFAPIIYSIFVCALAFAAAYVLELLDRRFRSAKDLEDVYGRPVFEIGEG